MKHLRYGHFAHFILKVGARIVHCKPRLGSEFLFMDRLFIFYDGIDKEIVVIRNGREFKSVGCVVFQIAVCYVLK